MGNISHLLGVISASLLAVSGVENCSSTVPSLQEWKHYLKVQGELHQPFRKEINIKHRRDHVWRTSTSGVRFSTVASTYHNRLFIRSPTIIEVKNVPQTERKLGKYTHFPLPWWEEQLFFSHFSSMIPWLWKEQLVFSPRFTRFFLSPRNFSSSANFSFWSSRKAEACDKVAFPRSRPGESPRSTRGLSWGRKEALGIKFQGFPKKKNITHLYYVVSFVFSTRQRFWNGFGGF